MARILTFASMRPGSAAEEHLKNIEKNLVQLYESLGTESITITETRIASLYALDFRKAAKVNYKTNDACETSSWFMSSVEVFFARLPLLYREEAALYAKLQHIFLEARQRRQRLAGQPTKD